MAVRQDIMRALIRSQRKAGDVVPFPRPAEGKKPRAKRRLKPKVVVVKPANTTTDPAAQIFYDKHGNKYRKVIINGKTHLRRSDGAIFRLRKDGKWVLISEPRGAAEAIGSSGGNYRRKKSGYGPAIGAGLAGAAAAGGIYAAARDDD